MKRVQLLADMRTNGRYAHKVHIPDQMKGALGTQFCGELIEALYSALLQTVNVPKAGSSLMEAGHFVQPKLDGGFFAYMVNCMHTLAQCIMLCKDMALDGRYADVSSLVGQGASPLGWILIVNSWSSRLSSLVRLQGCLHRSHILDMLACRPHLSYTS